MFSQRSGTSAPQNLGMQAYVCANGAASSGRLAESVSNLAKYGPKPVEFGPKCATHSTSVGQLGLESAASRPMSTDLGPKSTNLDQLRQGIGRIRPTRRRLLGVDRTLPNSAKLGPDSARSGPNSAKLGSKSAKVDQTPPGVDQNWTAIHQHVCQGASANDSGCVWGASVGEVHSDCVGFGVKVRRFLQNSDWDG